MKQQKGSIQPITKRARRTYDYPPVQTFTPLSTGRHIEEDREDIGAGEPDEPAYPRPPTSAIRYTTTKGEQVIERGHQRIVIHQGKPKRRYPWLLFILIGMIIALVIVYA